MFYLKKMFIFHERKKKPQRTKYIPIQMETSVKLNDDFSRSYLGPYGQFYLTFFTYESIDSFETGTVVFESIVNIPFQRLGLS